MDSNLQRTNLVTSHPPSSATRTTNMLNYIAILSPTQAVQLLTAAGLLYLVAWVIFARLFHPLSRFPGPFLASVTDWWYFISARWAIRDNTGYRLHQKYGKVVRIRPGNLSVSDPRAADVVYGLKPKWLKTEFYEPFDPHIEGGREIFTLKDETLHTSLKRATGGLWTVSAISIHEPQIDGLIKIFRSRLSSAASQPSEQIDLPRLLNQYTLDVLGEVFYGQSGGFGGLAKDIDYKNWTAMLTHMLPPLSVVGLLPWGTKTLYVMSQLLTNAKVRKSLADHDVVIEDAKAIVRQRVRERQEAGKEYQTSTAKATGGDMVSNMLDLVDDPLDRKHTITEGDVTAFVYDAIMAGFDTTGIALASILRSVLQHPAVYRKLQAEIDQAHIDGTLAADNIRYLDCLKLPYLTACINEGFRWGGVGGLGLPRRVPREGAVLPDGTVLPGGYVVTMNPECTNHDPETFGDDSELYRPERWIEEQDPEKLKAMERYLFNFGFGHRSCMGKHLASMETWKVLPAVMREFEFEMVGKPRVRHEWFKRIENFRVLVRRRSM